MQGNLQSTERSSEKEVDRMIRGKETHKVLFSFFTVALLFAVNVITGGPARQKSLRSRKAFLNDTLFPTVIRSDSHCISILTLRPVMIRMTGSITSNIMNGIQASMQRQAFCALHVMVLIGRTCKRILIRHRQYLSVTVSAQTVIKRQRKRPHTKSIHLEAA